MSGMPVQKSSICGAHIVTEGEEDFIACGASPTLCEKFTHKGIKSEYYVNPLLEDMEAFAIHVHSSSQSVTPRIFSVCRLPS